VVRDKKTGKPVAGVKVSLPGEVAALTDKAGRYELHGCPRSHEYAVLAQPQPGQPYLAAMARGPDTPGSDPLTLDLELTGGIPLQGRVTVKDTGKPPKRALVEYHALYPNPFSGALTRLTHLVAASSAPVDPDGSYRLTVLPGPGVVLVWASPRDSYATPFLDEEKLAALGGEGQGPGWGSWLRVASGSGAWWQRCVDRYNALALIDPDDGAKSLVLDLTVHRAHPLRGTVAGPDGNPLAGVKVSGLTSMPDAETLVSPLFAVEGLNPRRTRTLSFFHEEQELGKVVTIRGDQAGELAVELEPCGVVLGRMVDSAGKPVPGMGVHLGRGDNGLSARAETDDQGRFRATLVPGLKYRLGTTSFRSLRTPLGEIEVKSGQTRDLGDILLGDTDRR
jgi:hypothetical protein